MSKSKLKQIEIALNKAIPEGKSLSLGNDVFLTGELLDGSDKIYGFSKLDGKLFVVSRQCSDGYPLSELDSDDVDYMMPSILKKIKEGKYEIVKIL